MEFEEGFKQIQRTYRDNWDYRAVSTRIIEYDKYGHKRVREIIYYKVIDNKKKSEGVEVYSGENYIVGQKEKSYSSNYKINKYPKKYYHVVNELIKAYNQARWSDENKFSYYEGPLIIKKHKKLLYADYWKARGDIY